MSRDKSKKNGGKLQDNMRTYMSGGPNLFEKDKDKEYRRLLAPYKVFRDPVHGDIWLTELEARIVDSKFFQRLRRIRQLGLAYLVFHGANHTRYEHSLGTLFIAQKIIDNINDNFNYYKYSDESVTSRDTFITRIVALIHDMAHLPFGHTIEDEGNLADKKNAEELFSENILESLGMNKNNKFKAKQWLDNERRKLILGEIQEIIYNYIKSNVINLRDDIDQIMSDIEKILIAEELGDQYIENLRDKAFIADIVGNTICADLLDYIKRDHYYTGLKQSYDDRIFPFFVLKRTKNKNGYESLRLAIMVDKGKGVRKDIISYCIDLLRLRYSLFEKVFYHRVKAILSAMVIEMFYCATKGGIFKDVEDIMKHGDDSILFYIRYYRDIHGLSENNDKKNYISIAEKLADSLLNRKLYKVVSDGTDIGIKVNDYRDNPILKEISDDPQKRYKTEREIEDLLDFEPGSIIIYCPKPEEGKPAEAKIYRHISDSNLDGNVELTPLKNFREPGFGIEIELPTINKRYEHLWKLYVLASPDVFEDCNKRCRDLKKLDIKFACKYKFLNDNESLTYLIDKIADRYYALKTNWNKTLTEYQKEEIYHIVMAYSRGRYEDLTDLKTKIHKAVNKILKQ